MAVVDNVEGHESSVQFGLEASLASGIDFKHIQSVGPNGLVPELVDPDVSCLNFFGKLFLDALSEIECKLPVLGVVVVPVSVEVEGSNAV